MLLGYNILEYYTSKALRRWDDLENKDNTFIFPTGTICPLFLVSDTAETAGTVQIFDALTDVATGATKDLTITDQTTHKDLKYVGTLLTGLDCGYYYQKITLGTTTYYSEVFRWEDSVTDYLKISATSSSLTLANTYELDFTGIDFVCYVEAEESFDELEITEEGAEKPYGDTPIYNTLNNIHGFLVYASRSMLRFLFGLRILETNGTISFVFDGKTLAAYDVQVEKGETIGFDESVIINVQFKESNYISSRNEI